MVATIPAGRYWPGGAVLDSVLRKTTRESGRTFISGFNDMPYPTFCHYDCTRQGSGVDRRQIESPKSPQSVNLDPGDTPSFPASQET